MDEANYFPKLNRPTLISLAAGWASGFEGVNKISLHHYIGNNAEHRYALLFSLDFSSLSGMPSSDQSPGAWPSEYKTLRHIMGAGYIFTLSFRDVYADGEPPSGFEDEWFVDTVFDGEAYPSFARDKSWQLYPDPVIIETHSEKGQPERSKTDLSSRRVGTDEISEIRDPDTFIRSFQVSHVSPNEVSIRGGNKEAKNYTCGDMGFKSSGNGWNLLMEVLQDTNHLFDVGTYSKDRIPEKNRRYNQRQKWITQFTKDFVAFVNKEDFGAQIPDKTKLFENQKKKNRDGLYKPIFQVVSHDAIYCTDINKMSEQDVLKKIETLAAGRKSEKNADAQDRLLSDIGLYAQLAAKKRWLTEEQLLKLIASPDESPSSEDAMSQTEKTRTLTTSKPLPQTFRSNSPV